MSVDKATKVRYLTFKTLLYEKYQIDLDIDENFMLKLVDLVSNVYIKFEGKECNYIPYDLEIGMLFKVVEEYFYKMFDNKEIVKEINVLLDKAIFNYTKDYDNLNACIYRKFNLANPKISGFSIDYNKDIVSSSLMVHELGHALYLPSKKYLYNEVMSMTFQRIFGDMYYKELGIFQSNKSIESSFYNADRYDNIFFKKTRDKIKKSDLFISEVYLVGYISSLYLLERYYEDPLKFRNLLLKYRNDYDFAKKILDYYHIEIASEETIHLLTDDMEKVLKKRQVDDVFFL